MSAPRKKRFKSVVRAARLLARHKVPFSVLAIIGLLHAILLGVGEPLFQKYLIDAIADGNLRLFMMFGGGLLVLFIGIRLVMYLASLTAQSLKNQICRDLTLANIEYYYRIPYREVLRSESGYYTTRVYDDALQASSVVDLALELITKAVITVGALGVCLWLSWKLTLALAVIGPILIILGNRLGGRIRAISVEERECEGRARETLTRDIDSYKAVNLFGLMQSARSALSGRLDRYFSAIYNRQRYASGYQAISRILLSVAELTVLLGVGIQVVLGRLTIGGLFGFMRAYWQVMNNAQGLIAMIPKLAELDGYLQRIESFTALGEQVESPGNTGTTTWLRGVRIGYAENEVLHDVDLTLDAHEKLLISGPNGAGKSTLAHVLAGFLEPIAGDWQLMRRARISALLHPYGFIPGTVKDNVDFMSLGRTRRQRLGMLVSRFQLTEHLDSDPERLSDGQKRRVQLLMTLMKEADLYVLDEPLSNIDQVSKTTIMETLFEVTKGHCLVAIMHGDREFATHFDRELVIDHGSIVPADSDHANVRMAATTGGGAV